jgi:hypothetical protein
MRDQALWYYRRALSRLRDRNYHKAKAIVEQALALHSSNADFRVLAGRIWALEGEFQEASLPGNGHRGLTEASAARSLCREFLGRHSVYQRGHWGLSPIRVFPINN